MIDQLGMVSKDLSRGQYHSAKYVGACRQSGVGRSNFKIGPCIGTDKWTVFSPFLKFERPTPAALHSLDRLNAQQFQAAGENAGGQVGELQAAGPEFRGFCLQHGAFVIE